VREESRVVRRRQFCARCGQLMFEYHSSPDGHFGLVDDVAKFAADRGNELGCPTCGARYTLLERLSPTGQPLERK